ncbi:tumor necrosis factor ligand superfamily member 13B [Trichomycterus rosablanca]|uniref:tumor necrosis factor ligand superfamily member 13B n=1 Tax=Trichomycterus rosablanca TaxID=2290929 RepID=UPI002F35987A
MPGISAAPDRIESRRISWAVVVMILVAITSSSLSALSLYHVLALQAEVEGLRSEVTRRRDECRDTPEENVKGPQQQHEDHRSKGQILPESSSEAPQKLDTEASGRQQEQFSLKKRSVELFQPCLQMIGDKKRKVFQKDFELQQHTGIPWQMGLMRGSALEQYEDSIVVKEEGYYFIYSQVEHYDPPVTKVYYKDPTYAMGHIVIRIKKNVVGDESQQVVLFRCIKSMITSVPFNTCYTAGIAKLEEGDRVELLIPRQSANISLDGDCTFLGAVKLN